VSAACLARAWKPETPGPWERFLILAACILNPSRVTSARRAEHMDAVRKLRKHKDELFKRFDLERLGVFGSMARGDAGPRSDVDVLVSFREGRKTFDNFIDLKLFLEDLLRTEVDLVTLDYMRPRVRARVLGEIVYV